MNPDSSTMKQTHPEDNLIDLSQDDDDDLGRLPVHQNQDTANIKKEGKVDIKSKGEQKQSDHGSLPKNWIVLDDDSSIDEVPQQEQQNQQLAQQEHLDTSNLKRSVNSLDDTDESTPDAKKSRTNVESEAVTGEMKKVNIDYNTRSPSDDPGMPANGDFKLNTSNLRKETQALNTDISSNKSSLKESAVMEKDSSTLENGANLRKEMQALNTNAGSNKPTATDSAVVEKSNSKLENSAEYPAATTKSKIQEKAEVTDGDKSESHTKIIQGNANSSSASSNSVIKVDTYSIVKKYNGQLDELPDLLPMPMISKFEECFLDAILQIDDDDSNENWQEDWSGNLNFIDKEIILNRDLIKKNPSARKKTMTFLELVLEDAYNKNDSTINGFRGVLLLFSRIYHMKGTPKRAKQIMAFCLFRPAATVDERYNFVLDAQSRLGYDPQLLKEDGWTTTKASKPQGENHGAYLIGEKVIWDKYEAVVIAYLYDKEGIGDLWKLIYTEDLVPFDLELDEIQEGLKRFERRKIRRKAKETNANAKKATSRLTRNKYCVSGIDNGIVMALSNSPGAKSGVKWPARVLGVSEIEELGNAVLRSSSRNAIKNSIPVVFLAPYWNGESAPRGKASSATSRNPYSSGPLFHFEFVEASPEAVEEYTFDKVSIEHLRTQYQFSGLPITAFSRYVNAHRLAVALKQYAKTHLKKAAVEDPASFATLTDCHIMSVKTAVFPDALLNLPYDFILSHLPSPLEERVTTASDEEEFETTIDFIPILESMKPPYGFGAEKKTKTISTTRDNSNTKPDPPSPSPRILIDRYINTDLTLEKIASKELMFCFGEKVNSKVLQLLLDSLLSRLSSENTSKIKSESDQKSTLNHYVNQCLLFKAQGEDLLSSSAETMEFVHDWRKTCERLYRIIGAKFSSNGFGRGVTAIITDIRCNGHITAEDSFERSVRLPAAIKGSKLAGAGTLRVPLISKVSESYFVVAEKQILPKAHNTSYLRKMKNKIAAIPANTTGFPLTDDSDEGSGGEDTRGSRGSYVAAVTAVAASLQGVDMIVGSQCVNAFCAVRPPGHHAGKELRAMNAISNGFCIFNAAACAAIYAVSPLSEGGRGLRRVVVIDFDVHHGNGTQDILCATHDSRFLYISVHAGGAHINGYEDNDENELDEYSRRSLGGNKGGIFPGKCGDTSPHPGVLNIPLGKRVTSVGIGTALMTKVKPAVETFSPDLMILSAGFDAHVNDPLGMGGLSAADFGTVTEVCCKIADKTCSGRVLSLLEGGYGVPCCRPLNNGLFLPPGEKAELPAHGVDSEKRWRTLNLGSDHPDGMEDNIPPGMIQLLDKCHNEGFLDCVKEHVNALKCNSSKAKE